MTQKQADKTRHKLPLKQWFKGIISGLLGFILFLSLSGFPTLAQNKTLQFPILDRQPQEPIETEPPVSPTPGTPGIISQQEFANYVDNFFDQEMSKSHVPGAVISVVKDGTVFFAKGYGYANLEKKTPVVADRTLFRVASLSKLFTATATMQLYEQGQLDLEGDVSQYLERFQLDNPHSQPVTFAQLMMHTDGSTKRLVGLAARTEPEMTPLGDYLADYMPPIVWQPGRFYSYSNHAIALLGYLVEQISGRPYLDYINANILQPLDMQRSSFAQPPPPDLADNLAVGYQYQKGNYKAVPYLYLNIAPAASLSATATDMAHFMIAHLQQGRYQNQRILEADTAKLMHQTHFKPHPKLPGTSYGFRERLVNNMRAIGHLGSLRGYSSSLTLIPEQNIGIFIASNSFSGIHSKFLTQFFDHYFPVDQNSTPTQSLDASQVELERFTGTYRDLEYPRHTLAKLAGSFKHIQIKKGDDNRLQIQTPNLFFLNKIKPVQLEPVAPLLFKRMDTPTFTAFEENEAGEITFAYNPLFPKIGTYQRISWYEGIWVQFGLVGFCVVVFLSAMIRGIVHPLIQWWRGKHTSDKQQYNSAWLLAGAIATLNLVFLIGLPLSLWLIGVWKLVYGVLPVAIAFLCLPVLTALATLGLLAFTVLAWTNHDWSFGARSHYSVITLTALVFIGVLAYWNLLGFQF
jgi:CubicO group peptidase (beta-lactamase class C family)